MIKPIPPGFRGAFPAEAAGDSGSAAPGGGNEGAAPGSGFALASPVHGAAARRMAAAGFRRLIPCLRGLWSLPFPLALLALWWLASARGWAPEQILPSPRLVRHGLMDLAASGDLWMHLGISLRRLAVGFAAGAIAGLALGVALGLSATLRAYVYPSFHSLVQIPVLGWLPFLMMLVGIEEGLKYLVIAKSVSVPIALNTSRGLQGVPTAWIETARAYRFSRRQLIFRVALPSAFPSIWTGVRYGLSHGWLVLVVAELLASSEGLGFLIIYGRQLFQLDMVLAAVIVVGSVGWLLDRLLAGVETYALRWRREAF
jgi:sulfonate transport system permease protein